MTSFIEGGMDVNDKNALLNPHKDSLKFSLPSKASLTAELSINDPKHFVVVDTFVREAYENNLKDRSDLNSSNFEKAHSILVDKKARVTRYNIANDPLNIIPPSKFEVKSFVLCLKDVADRIDKGEKFHAINVATIVDTPLTIAAKKMDSPITIENIQRYKNEIKNTFRANGNNLLLFVNKLLSLLKLEREYLSYSESKLDEVIHTFERIVHNGVPINIL